jgi:thymidylate kinase
MNGLIIEGVAGTGKSTLLSTLKNSSLLRELSPGFQIIDEDQTTGDLVSELQDDTLTERQRCHRLYQLLPKIKEAKAKNQFLILERFHPTYYALMPDCELVDEFDKELAELGFGLILLDVPDYAIVNRSFFRPEMESQNWQKVLIQLYGSQKDAVKAFIASQENRRNFCIKTKMPVLQINTVEKSWQQYHDQVMDFLNISNSKSKK